MARFCLYSLLALPSVAYAAAVTSTITANPLETESTCPTRACTVHIPSGRVLKWMTFTPTSTFVAATVRVIVNNRTNATTTTTIFNTLPAGVEAPPTNADGTRIATVTSFAVTGGTTTVAYPSKWADYDSLVYWSGALTTKSTCTSVANATITLPPHPPIPQESLWVNGTMEAPDPEDPEGYFYSPYYEKYFAPVQTYAEELDEMALRDCVYTIASPPRALSGVKFLTTTETSIDTAGDGTAAPPSSPESTPAPAPSTTEVPPPPSNTEPAPPPSSSDTEPSPPPSSTEPAPPPSSSDIEPSQPPQQTSSPNPPALPVETGPSSSAQPPSPPAQSTAQQVPQPSNPSNPPTNPSNPPTNPENPQNPTTPTPQSPQNPTPENPQNPQNPTPENPTTPTPENPQNPQNPQNPTPENPATPSNNAPVVNAPNNSPTPENTPNNPNTPSNNVPAPIISVISSPPVVIIGTQPVTAAPGGSTFVVGSQTLTPGGTITVSGTTVALNPTAPVVVVNGESSSITAVQITTTIQRQTSAGSGSGSSATGTGGVYPSTTEEAPSEFTGGASGVEKSWKGAVAVGLLVGLIGGLM